MSRDDWSLQHHEEQQLVCEPTFVESDPQRNELCEFRITRAPEEGTKEVSTFRFTRSLEMKNRGDMCHEAPSKCANIWLWFSFLSFHPSNNKPAVSRPLFCVLFVFLSLSQPSCFFSMNFYQLDQLSNLSNRVIALIFFSQNVLWECSALLGGTFKLDSFHGLLTKHQEFSAGLSDAMLKVCATFYTYFMLPLYFCFYLSTPLFLTFFFFRWTMILEHLD